MLDDSYIDGQIENILREGWHECDIIHTIFTVSSLGRDDRELLALALEERLQRMFPEHIVTAAEYGVGEMKVSKERG